MELKTELRDQLGKIAVKKLRRTNKIPAILYRGHTEPLYLQLDEKVTKSIHEGEHITIDCGEKHDALIKEIQINPISSKIIHIDFQELKAKEKIKVKVPVLIEGEEMVVKQGWIMERGVDEIEIECLPKDIPDSIKVNVSTLKAGDSIHVKDLPEINGKFITKPDVPIVMVQIPKIVKETPPPEAAAVEGAVAEPGAAGTAPEPGAAKPGAATKPGAVTEAKAAPDTGAAKPAKGAKRD